MAADERNREMPHTVILEGREKLSISGVERLQLVAGELIVEGEVGCLEYDDSVQPRGGFFSRLFGG